MTGRSPRASLILAEFAADGRTNRKIADQLVLSVKTVEAHLRNIFAKLGVRSRVELARVVERRARATTNSVDDRQDVEDRLPASTYS